MRFGLLYPDLRFILPIHLELGKGPRRPYTLEEIEELVKYFNDVFGFDRAETLDRLGISERIRRQSRAKFRPPIKRSL